MDNYVPCCINMNLFFFADSFSSVSKQFYIVFMFSGAFVFVLLPTHLISIPSSVSQKEILKRTATDDLFAFISKPWSLIPFFFTDTVAIFSKTYISKWLRTMPCHAHNVKIFLMSKIHLLLLLCPQGLLLYNRRKLFALDKSMLAATQFSVTFQVTYSLLDHLVQ